jgi:hypothetical protein
MPEWESLRERLAGSYRRGLLVPFLGAGMSAPSTHADLEAKGGAGGRNQAPSGLPLWPKFVERLESIAAGPGDAPDFSPLTGADLTQRAARAVQRLQHSSAGGLVTGVRHALGDVPCGTPRQLRPLAQRDLHWPLVLTSNYDDLYVAAVHQVEAQGEKRGRTKDNEEVVPLELLGRSERDCQEVLASLRRPARPILWALQGFVGGQAKLPEALTARHQCERYSDAVRSDTRYGGQVRRLHDELVVGHAEYRRVALKSEPFRRAFAEVYRSRSLLFLGAGLRDRYLLDLFSEVVELYGPSPFPHVAFMKQGEADGVFLRQYFGIWVTEVPSFDVLPDRLNDLFEHLTGHRVPPRSGRQPRTLWWHDDPSFTVDDRPALEVVQGSLLNVPDRDGHCVVASAGASGSWKSSRLSNVGLEWLADPKRLGEAGRLVTPRDFKVEVAARPEGDYQVPIGRHEKQPNLFGVVARMNPWTKDGRRIRPLDPTVRGRPTANAATMRDVRLVNIATRQILSIARQDHFTRVHSMLLAAGRGRTFPQSSSLLQMVRGWSRFQQVEGASVGLTIYVYSDTAEVLVDLRSGRLDLDAGLDPDLLEFWIEIDVPRTPYLRLLARERADAFLLDTAAGFDITSDDWSADVRPLPGARFGNWTVGLIRQWEKEPGSEHMTLERFGVLPGSILRFSRDR